MSKRKRLAAANAVLKERSSGLGKTLKRIPREEWPVNLRASSVHEVWRSNAFLVQVFLEKEGVVRLSVNRGHVVKESGWEANIAWEELQWIKSSVGYGDLDAVEIYPPDESVVNVANMRHLWVLPYALDFRWGFNPKEGK